MKKTIAFLLVSVSLLTAGDTLFIDGPLCQYRVKIPTGFRVSECDRDYIPLVEPPSYHCLMSDSLFRFEMVYLPCGKGIAVPDSDLFADLKFNESSSIPDSVYLHVNNSRKKFKTK